MYRMVIADLITPYNSFSSRMFLRSATAVVRGRSKQRTAVDGDDSNMDNLAQDTILRSKNSKFKRINPDPRLLRRLDELSLGYLARRRARKAIAMRYEQEERQLPMQPIPPFDACPHNVVKIASVDSVDDIPPPLHYMYIVPEVCIIGRSNVGKSTLVNALLGFDNSFIQKCSVSDKPGETRRLDFYAVGKRKVDRSALHPTQIDRKSQDGETGDKTDVSRNGAKGQSKPYIKVPDVVLVDLPGYSFSFLPPEIAENLINLTISFLMGRGKPLKRVILLLDARHGFKVADKEFFEKLKSAIADIKSGLNDAEEFKIHWKLQVCLTKAGKILE